MQKFLAEMRRLTRRVSSGKIHPFLKQAHEITSAAIMRELKRRKLSQRELKHARKFLETTRYSRRGVWPERYAQLYGLSLQIAQNGNTAVLDHISETAQKIIEMAKTTNVKKGSSGLLLNPAISIFYSTKSACDFLEKDDPKRLKKDIEVSKPSPNLRVRLYRYLEEK